MIACLHAVMEMKMIVVNLTLSDLQNVEVDDDDERLISCPILMPFILSNKKILRNMLITVPCGF